MEKLHILICGPRGVGKSTLIEKLLNLTTLPVSGFVTRSTPRDETGYHSIYIHPAADRVRLRTRENHIGDCTGRERTVNTEVFTDVGVPLLQAEEGIIFMDELGFMETGSKPFCDAVLHALDGDIPVIAAVKERYDIPFLNQVRQHTKAARYVITKENRDALYEELSEKIRQWNKR
ncbi:MAG: hypothetical protein KH452_02810 [Clostridiales bacterium]|nr:hypothetical protein [Clostridiales bacterium]